MGSEWEYAELGDLVQIKGGKRLPKGEALSEQQNSHPYVRVRDLTDGRINTQDLLFVPDEVFEKIRRYTVDEGDIIVTIVGTVGLVATTPPSLHKASLTENAAKLIVSEEDKLDAEFLKWFLISHQGRHQIEINTVGSTQPKLPIYGIANIALPLPPLPEQKAIAHILGTLDDKIELNRRMNATLEGMAQALFKSWFVDFDPVIDNALAAGNPIPDELAPRAEVRKKALANATTQQGSVDHSTLSDPKSLFPAAFQFTEELGWIPEGWEVAKAEDIVTRHKVKQKFTKKNALEEGPVPIFDQGAGLLLGYSELPADQDSTKENPKFIFGDHTCITHLSTQPFSVGPNVIPLSAKTHAPYWTYYAVKDLQKFQEYRRHWMEFSINETVLPSPELASVFDNQAKEFRALMESKEETSKTLVRLRDTLLPKLIGGDLRLSEAEPLTEEAMA